MSAELQTRRGRIFFWIGIVVFPVFWIWWMNPRQFTTWQIRSARLWTILYVLAVAAAWWLSPAFRSRLINFQGSYVLIAIQIGILLWIWLLFRIFHIAHIFMGYVIGGEIIIGCQGPIARLIQQLPPLYQAMPPYLASLLFILIPVTAHLLLEPLRRFRVRLFIRIPWYSMNQTLVTETHAPINLTKAQQIADEYYSRASATLETGEQALAAMTFGIGWADQFMECCISSTTQISCTLQTSSTSLSWFHKPLEVTRQHQQQLHSRDALMQHIHDLFASTPEELLKHYKRQAQEPHSNAAIHKYHRSPSELRLPVSSAPSVGHPFGSPHLLGNTPLWLPPITRLHSHLRVSWRIAIRFVEARTLTLQP